MYAKFNQVSRTIQVIAQPLVIVALLAGSAAAQIPFTPYNLPYSRLAQEVYELKRLVGQLKQDERAARTERETLTKHRANAARFAGGGSQVVYQTGFVALVCSFGQSPGQAQLLQHRVTSIPADKFAPVKEEFPGGTVAELLEFCRSKHLSVRYGGKAQLAIAEFARDLFAEVDARLQDLDERIETLKAQNIAHTDIMGKLILAQAHCHHCHECFHHGYGACGGVVLFSVEPPIAGLSSQAYSQERTSHASKAGKSAGTDAARLTFLKFDPEDNN